jgi:hypothetical protein
MTEQSQQSAFIRIIDSDVLPTQEWLNGRIEELGRATRLVAVLPFTVRAYNADGMSYHDDLVTRWRCVFDTRGMVVAIGNSGG